MGPSPSELTGIGANMAKFDQSQAGWRRSARRRVGTTSVEYALFLAVILTAIMAAVSQLGGSALSVFSKTGAGLAPPSGPHSVGPTGS